LRHDARMRSSVSSVVNGSEVFFTILRALRYTTITVSAYSLP